MNDIRTLTKAELLSLYGINKYRHTKDCKSKNRYRLLACAFAFLFIAVCVYVGGLVFVLYALDLASIVPAYLVFLAALLVFVFGIFRGGHKMFATQGTDILLALPIRTSALVISRFFSMYLEDLLLTLAIMLPGTAVFAVLQAPPPIFYLTTLLITVFVPLIPLVLSTFLGTAVLALTSRMRRKSLVQALLMVVLLLAILLGSLSLSGATEEFSLDMLTELATRVSSVFSSFYPPALWSGNAMLGAFSWEFLLFLALSPAAVAVYLIIATRLFAPITRGLTSFSAKHNYKVGHMRSRHLLSALYVREARRYFSSSIYVMNTVIGPVLACIAAIILCVTGLDAFTASIPFDIRPLLPFVFAAIFTIMTTTSCAISMEGKQIEQIKSLPIPAKALFDSKILLNLSLIFPFYLVAEICLIIAIRPALPFFLLLIACPAALILFAVVFGITVNLKLHSFDWEKEEQVVKQSVSSMIGGFVGMLLSLLCGGIVFALPPSWQYAAMAGICLLLSFAACLLYRKNNGVPLDTL